MEPNTEDGMSNRGSEVISITALVEEVGGFTEEGNRRAKCSETSKKQDRKDLYLFLSRISHPWISIQMKMHAGPRGIKVR